jgi:hypothetical protein
MLGFNDEENCEKYCFLHNNYESEKLSSIENLFGIPCNDPKPLCKDHHCFGVFLKLFLSEVFRQTLC